MGERVPSPWQHSPSVQTSKEGGRTSNPNRQCSRSSFLKGYTQRRRRRAREGRVGCPRPSGDAPAALAPSRPTRDPRPASARGGRPGPSSRELGRIDRPGSRRREGGVCAPGGGADQPAFLPPALPAGSPPPGGRPTGPLPAPRQGGRQAARGAAEFRGERERAVSSGARRAGPN